jgi:hypothetical protein
VQPTASINYVRLDKKKRTWQIVYSQEEGDLKGFIVARIPFDWIVKVDWEGDEYYGPPHVYCRFIGKGRQPYEDILVYYKTKDSDSLWELEGYRQATHRLARIKARFSFKRRRRRRRYSVRAGRWR